MATGRWLYNISHDHNEDYRHWGTGTVRWHATPASNNLTPQGGPLGQGFIAAQLHTTTPPGNRLNNAGIYVKQHLADRFLEHYIATLIPTSPTNFMESFAPFLPGSLVAAGFQNGDIVRTITVPLSQPAVLTTSTSNLSAYKKD